MWLAVFQPRSLLNNKIPHIGLIFFIAYVLNNNNFFNIPPYNRNLNWKEDVKILQSSIDTGCPSKVTINISPSNWKIYYSSPLNKICD